MPLLSQGVGVQLTRLCYSLQGLSVTTIRVHDATALAGLFRYQVSCSCCNSNQGSASAFAGRFRFSVSSSCCDSNQGFASAFAGHFRYQVSCSCCNSNQGVAAAFAGSFSHDHTSLLWDLERRILKRSSLRRSGMTSSDQASRSEVSDALSMPSLRVCAPTPPGFSQCGLCGASAQDHDLRSLLRSPNQRRIWRQLVRVVIACLSISPVRRRGRGLRSVHGELRRAYRAFITCWQTETGLLLPTGMLPAPYGLALPQSAHFVAVAISADIAVVSSR